MMYNLKTGLLVIAALLTLTHCQSGNKDKGEHQTSSGNSASAKVAGLKGPDIVCLVYHRFGDDRYPSTNIKLDLFESHLQYLKDHDYTVLTFGEAIEGIKAGSLNNGPYAVITVDDGYETFKTGAMPLLNEYGYKATLFVNTESVGGNNYLDWSELNKLREQGIEIGNHSHAHPHFLNRDGENLIRESFKSDFKKAQSLFKEHMGFKPDIYAYPYGEYSPVMQEVLRAMNIKAAAAQHSGVLYPGSDMYAIPRYPMADQFAKMEGFKQKIKMKALRVSNVQPQATVIQDNPPSLQFTLETDVVNPKSLQCFVSGQKGNCEMKKDLSGEKAVITVKAKEKLGARRVKYTITAPGKNGDQWYWFSKLWVRPEKGEYE